MRTLSIPADAAPASLPSPGSAGHAAGEKTAEFSQVLQQWGSAVHPAADSGSDTSQAESLSHSSSAEEMTSQQQAAQPSNLSAPAGDRASEPASFSPGFSAALPATLLETVHETQENAVIGKGVVPNSGNAAKPGGTKKAAAKQASSQAPPRVAASSSIATPGTGAVPLPSPKQASLPPSAPGSASLSATSRESSGAPAASFSFDLLATGPVSEAAAQAPDLGTATASAATMAAEAVGRPAIAIAGATIGAVLKTLPSLTRESPAEAAQYPDIAKSAGAGSALALPANAIPRVATRGATGAVAAAAATSFAASSATSSATPPKTKPQAAISPAKAGGVAASASGVGNDARFAFKSAQPVANTHPLPAQNNFVQASSAVDHSLLRSGTDASPRAAKSSSKDESQTSSSANASGDHDSGTGTGAVSAIHAQTSSFSLPSAALQSAGMQNAGGQAAAVPSAAATASVSTVAPAPPQSSALPSAPQQFQPSVAAGPAHVVDSAQLQVRGNNSELKISVQLPELGKVEVRAVTAHDVTTAHLTASHQDALQMLAADRTTLEQALKSRDVILGSLDSHARDSHGHAGGEQRQQSSQSSAQSSGGAPSTAATATTSGLAETGTAGLLPDYSSISVRA